MVKKLQRHREKHRHTPNLDEKQTEVDDFGPTGKNQKFTFFRITFHQIDQKNLKLAEIEKANYFFGFERQKCVFRWFMATQRKNAEKPLKKRFLPKTIRF